MLTIQVCEALYVGHCQSDDEGLLLSFRSQEAQGD